MANKKEELAPFKDDFDWDPALGVPPVPALEGKTFSTPGSAMIAFKGSVVVATRWSFVVAMGGSVVYAQPESWVTAESGSKVRGAQGSSIIAFAGSIIVAESGCYVTAMKDARVFALPGSNVTNNGGTVISVQNRRGRSGGKKLPKPAALAPLATEKPAAGTKPVQSTGAPSIVPRPPSHTPRSKSLRDSTEPPKRVAPKTGSVDKKATKPRGTSKSAAKARGSKPAPKPGHSKNSRS